MSRKTMVLLSGLAGLGLLAVSDAYACGDKFLVVGRGVKYGRTHAAVNTASILIVGNVGSQAVAKNVKLEASLKEAGYKVRSVTDAAAADSALKSAKYDLVLADPADSSGLEEQVGGRSSKTVVVPVLYEPTADELAAAEKKYGCALKTPGKDYVATLDEIINTQLKGTATKAGKAK